MRWSERVLIGGEEIGEADFAAAVERTAQAAETVNRSLEPGEAVTQFEVATAAAFVAFAAARVEAAVVEAGLGGRLDATNTIPSRVTVLTSIGLDHTAWLGETELEIAAEKLAVLRDHTTLVLRPGQRRGGGAGRAHGGRTRGEADRRARGPRRGDRAARSGSLPAPQLRPRLRRRGGLPRRARPGARSPRSRRR